MKTTSSTANFSIRNCFVPILLLVSCSLSLAQPSRVQGTWYDGTNNTNISTLTYRTSATAMNSVAYSRGQSTAGGGTQTVTFASSGGGYPKWLADNTTPYSKNVLISSGAKYYASGGTAINFSTTNNYYYTFNVGTYYSASDNFMSILETSYNPTNISSISQSPTTSNVYGGQPVTVTINLASSPNTGEYVYLMYSEDTFTVYHRSVEVTNFSGGTGTAIIPAYSAGTTIFYYIITSTVSGLLGGQPESLALNTYNQAGQNASGDPFSYTVNAWTTVANGNWSSGSTWEGGVAPVSSSEMSTVNIVHNITQDQDANVTALFINGGKTLTVNSSQHLTLNGTGTLTGSLAVNGSLTFGSASSALTASPSYGSNATLRYWSGSTFTLGVEWPASNGPPNVYICNSTLNLNASRSLTGNLYLCGSATLKVTGGTPVSLTMNGTTQEIYVYTSSGTSGIIGTDNGSGNNLTLSISSGSTTTLTGVATPNLDHERKFFAVIISSGGTLALSRGLLVKDGYFSVFGTLQLNTNGYIQTGVSGYQSPSYGGSSTLVYNTTSVTQSVEWPSTSPTNVTVAAGTINLNASRSLSGNLTVSSGALQVTGGSGVTLTMNGTTQTVSVTGSGAITGTDNGAGNTLSLDISSASTTTITGDATAGGDVERKFYSVSVSSGATLKLARGLLVKSGTFTVSGTLQLEANGYVQASSGTSPAYAANASLVYNYTGGTFTQSIEWPSSSGPTHVTVSDGTISMNASRSLSGNLSISSGTLQVSGGSGITLTMNGTSQTITITPSSGGILGTDNGAGNNLSLSISSGSVTTLTGSATSNNDHEKKFYSCTVSSGGTLKLSRGILVKDGTFTVNGTLQLDANGYVQNGVSGYASPAYGSSAVLIYNCAGSFNQSVEWPASSGPNYVTLQDASTNVSMTAARTIGTALTLTAGTLTNGSNLTMANNSTIIRNAGTLNSAPAFGTAAPEKVNVTITTSTISSGNELLGTTGGLGALVIQSAASYTLTTAIVIDNLTVNTGTTLDASTYIITHRTGSGPTINGTFVCGNTSGFSGLVNSSISSTNVPVITLGANSTISYISAVAQDITARTYSNLDFGGVGQKNISSSTYEVTGNFTVSGGNVVVASGNSFLVTGTGSKNIAGINFYDVSFSGGGTKSVTSDGSVTNSMTLSGSTTVDVDGPANNKIFTIKSTASGTGRIAAIPSGSTVSGSITVERYIPSVGRRWRFLSTAVSGSDIEDWRGEIHITGHGSGGTIGSVPNSNGFDATAMNQPSVYWYDETYNWATTNLNQRWQAITHTNNSLVTGRGYRVFVRGPRTDGVSLINGSSSTQNAVTIDTRGTLIIGSSAVTLPVDYSGATGNDGWNFVGNPFASQIDWNASSGWTKTDIAATIWIYNPATNSYGNWDGTTATNGCTRYIASGQAFFVRALSVNRALSCTEDVKVSNTPSNLFKSAADENLLRIKLLKDSFNSDETVIRFMENKSDAFDEREDVLKLVNEELNLSSVLDNSKYVSVNYLNKNYMNGRSVKLSMWTKQNGSYSLCFDGKDNFPAYSSIWLIDHFENKQWEITRSGTYFFQTTDNLGSKGDDRFEIIFYASASNTGSDLETPGSAHLQVYPSPAKERLFVLCKGNKALSTEWILYSAAGQALQTGTMELGNHLQASIDISALAGGTYFIQFIQPGLTSTARFVKAD